MFSSDDAWQKSSMMHVKSWFRRNFGAGMTLLFYWTSPGLEPRVSVKQHYPQPWCHWKTCNQLNWWIRSNTYAISQCIILCQSWVWHWESNMQTNLTFESWKPSSDTQPVAPSGHGVETNLVSPGREPGVPSLNICVLDAWFIASTWEGQKESCKWPQLELQRKEVCWFFLMEFLWTSYVSYGQPPQNHFYHRNHLLFHYHHHHHQHHPPPPPHHHP